jgi:hypothetical protein
MNQTDTVQQSSAPMVDPFEMVNPLSEYLSADGRLQVSVYAVDRHFGGHEEGGWWYDWYKFTGISERCAIDQIEDVKARLLLMFADKQPKYPISSAASNGPEYWAMVEGKAGESETKERPQYS